MKELIPTKDESYRWALSTGVKHSLHVEYYLDYFSKHYGIVFSDPQRPHDLVGPGNKLEWDAIKGFALERREPKVDFNIFIKPSLEFHRQQYHHKKWNGDVPSLDASEADMILGAVDAVCSLREARKYHDVAYSWDEISEISKNNPAHKEKYMQMVIPIMRDIKIPDIKSIKSLLDIPNIGLDQPIYNLIVERAKYADKLLELKYPEPLI